MFGVYFDEDSGHHAVVGAARRAGFQCLTTKEAGRRRRPDTEQLEFATEAGLVVYTCNAGDYGRLDKFWSAEGRIHAGIIVLTDQRAPVGVQLRALQNLAASVSAEEMRGRLVFLLNWA
ncbi:MAG: hypothetical protein C0506_01255 [Anaerolinea sp.]|nr:hypothetical protein [Anaerolinea sp.]